MIGARQRKDPSDSSASAIRNCPSPKRALLPKVFSLPPMMTVASSSAYEKILASKDVEEV